MGRRCEQVQWFRSRRDAEILVRGSIGVLIRGGGFFDTAWIVLHETGIDVRGSPYRQEGEQERPYEHQEFHAGKNKSRLMFEIESDIRGDLFEAQVQAVGIAFYERFAGSTVQGP